MEAQTHEIDSIRKLMIEQDDLDKKLELLYEFTKAFQYNDLDSTLFYAERLYNKSKTLKNEYYQVKALNLKHIYFIENSENDSAKFYLRKAYSIVRGLKNDKESAMILGNFGRYYYSTEVFDSAKYYYSKALELNRKIGDTEGLGLNNYMLGLVADNSGSPTVAIKYFLEAKENFVEINNQFLIANTNNLIGVSFLQLEDYKEAENYFLNALKEFDKLNTPVYKANILNNLGRLYGERDNNHSKSIEFYRTAFNIYVENDVDRGACEAAYNIGSRFRNLANTDSCRFYLTKSLNIAEKIDYQRQISRINGEFSEYYIDLNNLEEARVHNKKCLDIALEKEYQVIQHEALTRQSTIESLSGNYRLALQYLNDGVNLAEEIYNQDILETTKKLETKYQVTQKENENLQLKQKNQQQELRTLRANRRNNLLGLGLGATALLGGVAFVSYRNSDKQKKRIENLQRELHHRLKNNLSLVDAFLDTSEKAIEDEKTIRVMHELKNRIGSIARVHELLVKSDDITKVNLEEYVNQLGTDIMQTFPNNNIQLFVNVPKTLSLDSTKSFPVGMIINEFITNSMKYAFPDKHGYVRVDINEQNKVFDMKLSDDGVGMNTNIQMKQSDSFGLRIMHLLTEQLKGKLDLQAESGTTLQIKFPA